jgi:hypothetical protein
MWRAESPWCRSPSAPFLEGLVDEDGYGNGIAF